ncbi:hypothetical protein BLA60_03675 [Actinophytocola xinjiangensis]|uniref:Long-chain-fatty-acyl-CoA reductase n=1 Tax=Actinophytocola xinjiangensis TaxID=485602 RepID=A0A7Z1B047_9PSEU|nr:acyl-CoA reductase [Actinophytocola xinjiangensis]OLF14244.1 hypothetical protein BLA60_03675 [Actinophytocola xinjiangensis]
MSTLVERLCPDGPPTPAERVPPLVADSGLAVGDERVVDVLASLSQTWLGARARADHPELAALGFFLRPAQLTAMRAELTGSGDGVRRPVGLVLHHPPSNVDAVLGYAWALSALCGNRNIVRVSGRAGALTARILDDIATAFATADPVLARTQLFVGHPHDDEVTDALARSCDLRVIWGGDQAITDLRRAALPAHARDLVFPNRHSLAVVNAAAYLDAPGWQRARLAAGLCDDVLPFDQAACSSPRALVLVGAQPTATAAWRDLRGRIRAEVDGRDLRLDPAMAVEKRVRGYGLAADGVAGTVEFDGEVMTYLGVPDPARLPRDWLGAGVLAIARVDECGDLAALLTDRHQTLGHFGFGREELRALCRSLGSRRLDRVVPIGTALTFDRHWDGHDLLHEFTRHTTISGWVTDAQ